MPASAGMTEKTVRTPGGRSSLRDAAKIARLRSAFAPVRQREVLGRAHFMQAGGGAREFERLRAFAGIERLRFARRRGDQLDAHVVEGVDQDDEALRLIALAGGDHGDAVEHERVKALS